MSLEQTHDELLAEFRIRYHQIQDGVTQAFADPTDPVVLEQLGDEVDDFAHLVLQVCIYAIIYVTLVYN